MSYALLKMIHVSSVILSYSLFFLRGIWLIRDSANLRQRWVKILPHIIDTVLLTSAVFLAMAIQQNPLQDSWLTAKVAGLLLYIALGMVAIRFGKTRRTKIIAWVAAQCVFIYIVLVAVTKSPVLGLG
ncbi:MAG: SirB2 family protein [Nitrosomonas sp.]|uniref:SirB2 family protein n=1 Tax=Nitrosomonas sp. TaxID=42353 RepID=UPI0025DDC038|nr:SirB2 family protein [Nitrosomonas sp.]MCG7755851.1 SirB2 family protein [Nitrosomonas sp.]UJP00999.1 MAG: SirB2 family protein [Nitrosomonas sp.]UJP01873.1 MAG: SirB2 family protein [Nitrosomonas sp.]UJP06746.1 MAG: SirB2 family protein [Nitrosomonas sp.]